MKRSDGGHSNKQPQLLSVSPVVPNARALRFGHEKLGTLDSLETVENKIPRSKFQLAVTFHTPFNWSGRHLAPSIFHFLGRAPRFLSFSLAVSLCPPAPTISSSFLQLRHSYIFSFSLLPGPVRTARSNSLSVG